jgi:hypothetical protein
MLYEIVCDEFKLNKIIFNSKLNTILGDDIGSNSIGKSTMLMIIDFAFGGKDYTDKLLDVQKNIGPHIIKFSFLFEDERFYFLRKTHSSGFVWICDNGYEPQREISLDNYCFFLKEKYKLETSYSSFRDMVGRYSRIYGKENLNEKKPLDIVPNETSGAPINALIKIFNKYEEIKESEERLKEKKSEFKAYKEAQKYQYVSSIGKRQYNKNVKEKEIISESMNELIGDLNKGLVDLDLIKTEEILSLKRKLSYIRKKRSRLESELDLLADNLNITKNVDLKKFDELSVFFPQLNTDKLKNIEKFHKTINVALQNELKNKKIGITKLIEVADKEKTELERELDNHIEEKDISTIVLKKYADMQKQIDKITVENSSLEKYNELKEDEKTAKEQRIKIRSKILDKLEKQINEKLNSINDYIYSKKKKSPILTFEDNKYSFQTIDDNGTGNNYKSMIIYDLSILEMTQLPILIHDSVVLKQIEDVAIEKILTKYLNENKQIFISLDKKKAYSKESQKILLENKVLELSPNGNELFGRSWNKTE